MFVLSAYSTAMALPPSGGTVTIGHTSHLTLGASNLLSGANIDFAGGSLSTSVSPTGASAGNSDTVGTIKLSDNSTIELGTGVHRLVFSASSAITWTGTDLVINGWQGTAENPGTAGKIYVGMNASGLDASQLA